MGVTIKTDQKETIALISGDIDHHTAKDIRENIDDIVSKNSPQKLKLDFGGVSFMDSSGIGLIMGRYKLMKQKSGDLEVVNMPPNIERVIKLSGLGALNIIKN